MSQSKQPFLPEVTFANHLAKNLRGKQISTIDLHGFSEKEAQNAISKKIKDAETDQVERIRFITGRGNHINAQGKRGTLYHNFGEWLQDVQKNISAVHQFDGFYEVEIHANTPIRSPIQALMTTQVQQLLTADIKNIQMEAEKGVKDNLLALAACYQYGLGVQQSYPKMFEIFKRLADDGDPLMQYEVGCSYFIGRGVRQNDEQARAYLRRAHEQHFSLASLLLGDIYWRGTGVNQNYIEAYAFYERAAQHDLPEASRKLGFFHANGLGANKVINYPLAIQHWRKGDKLKDGPSAYNLFIVYNQGAPGVSPDKNLACHYLKHAADFGDPNGQYHFAIAHFGNAYGKPDHKMALKLLEKAKANRSEEAMFHLFLHFFQLKNFDKAKENLLLAAEEGHILAQFFIAGDGSFPFDENIKKKMTEFLLNQSKERILSLAIPFMKYEIIDFFLFPNRTKNQKKMGMSLLKYLAEQGEIEAIQKLYMIYLKGEKPNPTEALKYLLQGEKLNDTDCICTLGYFWQDGLGGKIDLDKAFMYFSKAAEKGSANAHNQLGILYSDKKQYEKAEHHYREVMRIDPENEFDIFKHAAHNLGCMLLGQDELSERHEEAISLITSSMEAGHSSAAFYLFFYYRRMSQKKAAFYHLVQAAKLGHTEARTLLTNMGLDYIIQNSPDTTQRFFSTKREKSKATVLTELSSLNVSFGENLEWKISKENTAWTYISDTLHKQILQMHPEWARKTQDGKCVLILEDIFNIDLHQVAEDLEQHKSMDAPQASSSTNF